VDVYGHLILTLLRPDVSGLGASHEVFDLNPFVLRTKSAANRLARVSSRDSSSAILAFSGASRFSSSDKVGKVSMATLDDLTGHYQKGTAAHMGDLVRPRRALARLPAIPRRA
jgi:hypothetical protein